MKTSDCSLSEAVYNDFGQGHHFGGGGGVPPNVKVKWPPLS